MENTLLNIKNKFNAVKKKDKKRFLKNTGKK